MLSPSQGILKRGINHWLKSRGRPDAWLPPPSSVSTGLPAGSPQDVVLFGNLVTQLLQTPRWRLDRGSEFRLWALSTPFSRVASELLGIPPEQIGVAPRYEVFPREAPARPLPDPRKPWTLVYAGRISPSKNFLLLLRTVSLLQTELGHKTRLVCYGSFDGLLKTLPELPSIPGVIECFEDQVRSLISRLPWTTAPSFLGYTSRYDDWLRRDFDQPVAISLSQSDMEDFGVSLAQAQSAGWPCIASDWGGHRDLAGHGVVRVPPHPPLTELSESVAEGHAWALAHGIDQALRCRSRGPRRTLAPPREPEPIRYRDLLAIHDRIGPELGRLGLNPKTPELIFADSHGRLKSSSFLRRYCGLLSGEEETKKTVVVFSGGKRSDWPSIEEVIPAIETAWAALPAPDVTIASFRSRPASVPRALPDLLRASAIVFTELSPELLRILRGQLRLAAPILIHTHGEFAEGALIYSELRGLLRDDDRLIAASTAEARAIKAVFGEAKVHVVPPPLARGPARAPRVSKTPIDLVYVGRISEQKNIHEILQALWLLKRRTGLRPRLRIFGVSDTFGFPQFGRRAHGGYDSRLRALAERLGISGQLSWEGFLPRRELYHEILKEPYVFISTSIHSNEDFGVAAFQALQAGNRAVLSRWGGHGDLARAFPSQVLAVPVRESELGPFVPCEDLAHAIFRALSRGGAAAHTPGQPGPYSIPSASRSLLGILKALERHRSTARGSFERSEVFEKILRRQGSLKHAFTGYNDPLYRPFLKAYGLKQGLRPKKVPREILLFPWVEPAEGGFALRDPRRGSRFVPADRAGAVRARSASGKVHRLDARAAAVLLQAGAAVPS